jgi:hypothetical protein
MEELNKQEVKLPRDSKHVVLKIDGILIKIVQLFLLQLFIAFDTGTRFQIDIQIVHWQIFIFYVSFWNTF